MISRKRIIITASMLTLAFASSAWGQKAAEKASDAGAVRAVIEAAATKFTSAIKAGDVATAAKIYAPDVVILAPNAPVTKGHAAAVEMLTGWLSQMTVSEFTLKADEVIVVGDYLIESGSYSMVLQLKSGGPTFPDQGKFLTVWQRQKDGSWKIIRDAFNTDMPAPMK